MHVRVSKSTRNGKTYRYAQLVQSYRREKDGMPAHRVIANLGSLSDDEVANLRTALKASRSGTRIVLPLPGQRRPAPAPVANLAYLDLAVLHQLWAEGPGEWLTGLLPGALDLRVVEALVLQRCTAPNSKLAATRWFPRTALPELLGVSPGRFNNTRVHRVLQRLEKIEDALQRQLSARQARTSGGFAALFLDLTDTWFVGDGPPLAESGKTKEGLHRHKVGLVLLCDDAGRPLRWKTIAGRSADAPAMLDMIAALQGADWAMDVPLVMDRAIGRTAWLRELLRSGLQFVTAITRPEFGAYVPDVPHEAFDEIDPEDDRDELVDRIRCQAEATAMTKVADDLFVLDCGVVERAEPTSEPTDDESADAPTGTARAMKLAREITDGVQAGRHASFAAAGRERGLSAALTHKYRTLVGLTDSIQQSVHDGHAVGRSISELVRIARLPPAEQQQAYSALLDRTPRLPRVRPQPAGHRVPDISDEDARPVRVRAVVMFNPRLLVDRRRTARRQLEEIDAFVKQLNRKLAEPTSRRSRDSIAGAVHKKLASNNLVSAFDVQIRRREVDGRSRFRVTVQLDEQQWRRRRRYDGFNILVAEPSIPHTAPELARLYRQKDRVEKDFQTIKSVLELRPVRHRTDHKVRAHVTVCMLALHLLTTLDARLGSGRTATTALEILATCHLNLYEPADAELTAFAITRPDTEQCAILDALHLRRLARDQEITNTIIPRS